MKKIMLNILFLCVATSVLAQEQKKESFFTKHPFVNMTEIGGLFGRVQSPTYYYPMYYSSFVPTEQSYTVENRLSISVQTFNGVYIKKKTAVGITTGVDWYNSLLLLPIQAGVRQTLIQKKNGGSSIYASLDAGYATTWLNADNSYFDSKGGFTASPAIGFKLPMRGGSSWLINFGYKYQHAKVTQSNQYDPYWSSVESKNYNRFVVRMGVDF